MIGIHGLNTTQLTRQNDSIFLNLHYNEKNERFEIYYDSDNKVVSNVLLK